jgi:murein DD-endopeptidase MepM/ murein hydrolase activator NlpD
MVPPMAPARHRDAARLRARRRRPAARQRADRNARRILFGTLLSAVLLLTLLLTAFGSAASTPRPLAAAGVLPGGQPQSQVVATVGSLRLQLPVAQGAVTAIGYHRAGPTALRLDPVGRQGNVGPLTRLWHRLAGTKKDGLVWFQLSGSRGPGTSALDVGAAPGTDVYAPVDGVVVGLADYVVSNRVQGARIDIRPHEAPSVVVSLAHLRPDPALTVGSTVASGRSKIGVVLDLSRVEYQALARHTQDAGNNVTLEVHPAATLSIR